MTDSRLWNLVTLLLDRLGSCLVCTPNVCRVWAMCPFFPPGLLFLSQTCLFVSGIPPLTRTATTSTSLFIAGRTSYTIFTPHCVHFTETECFTTNATSTLLSRPDGTIYQVKKLPIPSHFHSRLANMTTHFPFVFPSLWQNLSPQARPFLHQCPHPYLSFPFLFVLIMMVTEPHFHGYFTFRNVVMAECMTSDATLFTELTGIVRRWLSYCGSLSAWIPPGYRWHPWSADGTIWS